MNPRIYFVELLTVRSWLTAIWPRLLRERKSGDSSPARCFYFDASSLALYVVKATAWAAGVKVEWFDFKLREAFDEYGQPIRKRIGGQDLAAAQTEALNMPAIQEALRGVEDRLRFKNFLAKKIVLAPPPSQHSVRRALYMVHIAAWHLRRSGFQDSKAVMFLERAPWLESVTSIANGQNIDIAMVSRSFDLPKFLRNMLPRGVANVLIVLRQKRLREALALIKNCLSIGSIGGTGQHPENDPKAVAHYVAASEFTGQMNLDHPERHSNLFFWQQSPLNGSDMMVAFTAATCPLTESNWNELSLAGMSAVVTYPGAATVANAPVVSSPEYRKGSGVIRPGSSGSRTEKKWIERQYSEYEKLRQFWTNLFRKNEVGVFATFNKLEAPVCAIFDALEHVGGISVNYERSFGTFPSPDFNSHADVMFNFSQVSVDTELKSDSSVKYHVVTGYLGDHRFPLVKEAAQEVRDGLQKNGAKQIMAYFDENSPDSERWSLGHAVTQGHYSYLLEKVLSEPWFGLVLKPKTPRSLRKRLGPVADLLDRAESTGRCHMFKEGGIQGWHPPSAAAQAADVAVNGHIWACTAALESALSGVPTLLVDIENWKVEPLYSLGVGRVVFESWDDLWQACVEHWSSPTGIPGFGDWSHSITDLDPFRDGRAAERMGTYIQWMLEGLRSGMDRDTVLANTAERYRVQWGHDKITHVGDISNPKKVAAHEPDRVRNS